MRNLVSVAIVALLLGMTLATGLCGGFLAGRWWGEWELNYLMSIPQGGMVLSHRTGASWFKLDNNTMRFMRVPDPRQARIAQIFPKEKANDKEDDSGSGGAGNPGSK